MDYLSLAASAMCDSLVVLVEGLEALVYGAIIWAAARSTAEWILDRMTATRFTRFLIKTFANAGAKLLYLLVGAVALTVIFVFSALFALLFNRTAQRSTTPAGNNATNATLNNVTAVCQCPAPSSYSIAEPLTCDGRVSHAAMSILHDLNAFDQVEEDLSFIARGRLADLNKAWVRQGKAFVFSYDSIRNQYTHLQTKSIPRYIAAERERLSGGGDSDCVDVEWIAVQSAFQALEEAGSSCEKLWSALYEQSGLSDQIVGRITASKGILERQPIGHLTDLIPGMSPNDRRRSHSLLSGALKLVTSLQAAHDSAQHCKRDERRMMEASWKESTEDDVAGMAVRKDIGYAELESLVEKRLNWAMLYTSPDSMDLI